MNLAELEIATVYHDKRLSASVVVLHGGRWWLVPNCAGGWWRRMPLNLSDEARRERLTLATDVDVAWLGIET